MAIEGGCIMATRLYTKSDLAKMVGKSIENLDRDLRTRGLAVPDPEFVVSGPKGKDRFLWIAESTRAWCDGLGFTFSEKPEAAYKPSS